MTNSRKKRKSRKRKSNPSVGGSRRRRRNSFLKVRRRSHRRNPSGGGSMNLMSVLKLGGGAAIGSIAARGIPQALLKEKNTGLVGYGSNLATSVALAFLTKKFTGQNEVAVGLLAGGVGATMVRIYAEKVSQTSPAALAGLGDVDFSDDGLGLYNQLPSGGYPEYGRYLPAAQIPVSSGAAPVAAVVAGGAQQSGRFKSRFAS